MNKNLIIGVLNAYMSINDGSLTIITEYKTFEDCHISDLDLNIVYIRDKYNDLFSIKFNDIICIQFADHMALVGMK